MQISMKLSRKSPIGPKISTGRIRFHETHGNMVYFLGTALTLVALGPYERYKVEN